MSDPVETKARILTERQKRSADAIHAGMVTYNNELPDGDPRKITDAMIMAMRSAEYLYVERQIAGTATDGDTEVQVTLRQAIDALDLLVPQDPAENGYRLMPYGDRTPLTGGVVVQMPFPGGAKYDGQPILFEDEK